MRNHLSKLLVAIIMIASLTVAVFTPSVFGFECDDTRVVQEQSAEAGYINESGIQLECERVQSEQCSVVGPMALSVGSGGLSLNSQPACLNIVQASGPTVEVAANPTGRICDSNSEVRLVSCVTVA